ncbi:MAG TPA: aminopeptidase [Myxococcota bacterium]|jgi:aspartyl aminopeptidase|nr:aminopeptidase [Myxococcota bacterium]
MSMHGSTCACAVALLALGMAADAGAGEPKLGTKPTIWEAKGGPADDKTIFAFGDAYRDFLSANKTEREVVATATAMAEKAGFKRLDPAAPPAKLAPGAKLYYSVEGKILALVVVGKRPIEEGFRVVGAHIDAVRLDLKQRPLFEDGNIALLETHYYGGIKPYHWLSMPLALHGVVIKRDGTRVDVRLGDDLADPVLVIPDLLAHLSGLADDREGEEIPKEKLDVMVASRPDPKGGGVRGTVLTWLKTKYGVAEDDLESAELEVVPASPARDVGIDRAAVGGYGQDDRACSYATLRATLEMGTPDHTAIALLVDKEEIGSTGVTGMDSVFLPTVASTLLRAALGDKATDHVLRTTFTRSMALSADVTLAADPLYPDLYDAKNVAYFGAGPSFESASHSELAAHLRDLLLKARVTFQTGEFGKVVSSKSDAGTILPFITRTGVPGMNLSIPLLSMHAPFEIVSKADLYHGYLAYKAFLED